MSMYFPVGRGASVICRAWRPKRWPTWVGQGQGELRHGEWTEADRSGTETYPQELHCSSRVGLCTRARRRE